MPSTHSDTERYLHKRMTHEHGHWKSCLLLTLVLFVATWADLARAQKMRGGRAEGKRKGKPRPRYYPVLPPPNSSHWDGHEYPVGHNNFGVRVPFYLHSGGGFDAFTASCDAYQFSKSVDVSWLNRLDRHPWRVMDPADALVFVVPGMFTSATFGVVKRCRRSLEDMSRELLDALHASPHFQRNHGRDHVLVASFNAAEKYLSDKDRSNGWGVTVANMTIGPHVSGHMFTSKRACVVPVGHQATSPEHRAPPKITSTLFFMGQAVGKGYYAARRAVLDPVVMEGIGENNQLLATQCNGINKSGTMISDTFPMCGSPAAAGLANPNHGCCLGNRIPYELYIQKFTSSSFALSMRGGDAGSSRTFDAIAMGVPQIVIADKFYSEYAPFQCTVPWHKFVYYVESEEAVVNNTRAVMAKALAEALPRRKQMKRVQDSFMDDLLWTNAGSLAANNLLVEVAKKCLPPPTQHASAAARQARAIIDAHSCVPLD